MSRNSLAQVRYEFFKNDDDDDDEENDVDISDDSKHL